MKNDEKNEKNKMKKIQGTAEGFGSVATVNNKGVASVKKVSVTRYRPGVQVNFEENFDEKNDSPQVNKPHVDSKPSVHIQKKFNSNNKNEIVLENKIVEKTIDVDEINEQFLSEESEKSSNYSTTSSSDSSSTDILNNKLTRLKPLFIQKDQRQTEKQSQQQQKSTKEERIAESKSYINNVLINEANQQRNEPDASKNTVQTDDEADEQTNYEAWKLRELTRMKRDIDERQTRINERIELEKVRNMTEEQRAKYFEKNPKFVSNQAGKSQYKFLQKYYHRGAFYLDKEDEVLKRDFDQPTLEDNFDRSALPKFMQVRNFGKAGRTKYTHLTDQDTTDFWNISGKDKESIPEFYKKMHVKVGGGLKQVFDKPKKSRKRPNDNAADEKK